MTVLVLIGIMASITMWQVTVQLPRYRTTSAAGKILLDLRKATAIASRTNRPVTFTMNPEGCTPGYTLTQGNVGYERICFESEFPSVGFGATGAEITCPSEAAAGVPAIESCSLCSGTSTILFLPSGEVNTASGSDESLIIGPLGDLPTFDRAIGIRNITGKARAYVRRGAGWDCP